MISNSIFAIIEFNIVGKIYKKGRFIDFCRGGLISIIAYLIFFLCNAHPNSLVPFIMLIELLFVRDKDIELRRPTWTIIGMIIGWAILNIRIISVEL